MTEINIPTCERCGTPKAFPETDLGCPLCPLPESACQSITALHSEVEALRKRNEELEAAVHHLINCPCCTEQGTHNCTTQSYWRLLDAD